MPWLARTRLLRPAVWLDRHPWVQILAWSVPYALLTGFTAAHRPLWFDEVLTAHEVTFEPWRQLLSFLRSGVDLQPPLFYWITRASAAMVGHSEFGYRLPAMLAFWVACLCVSRFVTYRASALAGTAAALCLLNSHVYAYAFEARPYALVFAFIAIAMLFWQRVEEVHRRRWMLCGLTVSIAVAVSTHYYGIIAVAALFGAELLRAVLRRKLDPACLSAIALGGSCLLLYLPLIRSGLSAHGGRPWNPASLTQLALTYELGFRGQAVPAGIVLAGLCLYGLLYPELRRARLKVPAGELGLCVALLLIPIGCYISARFGSNMMVPRYGIAVALPVALSFAWLCLQLSQRRRSLLLAANLFLGLWFVAFGIRTARDAWLTGPPSIPQLNEAAYRDLPVIFADSFTYLPFWYYGDAEFRARSALILDPLRAFALTGNDRYDRSILANRRFFPLPGRPWSEFSSSHRQFLFCWSASRFAWVQRQLQAEGARWEFLQDFGDWQLYLVSLR